MFTSPAFIRSLLFALVGASSAMLASFASSTHPVLAWIGAAASTFPALGLTFVNSSNAATPAAPSTPAATPPTVAKP